MKVPCKVHVWIFISNHLLQGKRAVYFKMSSSLHYTIFNFMRKRFSSLQNFNLFQGRESEISKIFCCATFNLEIGGQKSTFPLCTGWLKVALRITAQYCRSYVHRTLDLLVSGYELWIFTSRAKSCCLWELSPDSCIFILLLEM